MELIAFSLDLVRNQLDTKVTIFFWESMLFIINTNL